ncbi:MAG: serine hydrolase domain-containing protein [Bacteroidota bacterium]
MKPVKFYIVASFIIFSVVSSFSQEKNASGISVERLKKYENLIKTKIDQQKIPGAVVLIVRNGQTAYNSAFGSSDITGKVSMKTDDIFYIQSMTKPIITVAFMMLYEEGRFLLTDKVSSYLPEFKNLRVSKNVEAGLAGETVPMDREITIAHLLTHTSGLTHGLGSSALDKEFIKEYFIKPWPDIQARAGSITKMPLMGQPGNQWYYSAAPDVLSALIEKFSGMTTENFLNERIFKPLGMKDTGYNLTKTQQARVVKVHSSSDGALRVAANQPAMEGNTIWSGVNGLYSTASDYMKFCQMLLNGGQSGDRRYLSRKTVELMTYNHTGKLFNRPGEGFGLGFAVVTDVAETKLPGSVGLYYWAGAFNTHFFIDPKEKLISIFMTHEEHFNQQHHDVMRQMVYQAITD